MSHTTQIIIIIIIVTIQLLLQLLSLFESSYCPSLININ